MKKTILGVAILSLLSPVALVRAEFALSAADVEKRLLIVFNEGVNLEEQKKLVQKNGFRVLREFKPMRGLVVESKSDVSQQSLVALLSDPKIFHVGEDFYANWLLITPEAQVTALNRAMMQPPIKPAALRTSLLPPAKAAPSESDYEIQWGVARVNAPAAWKTNRGAGVKVAIVDTGIDPEHPDLKGNIKGGYNAIDQRQPWADDHFHGTHVAGIVAASLNGFYTVGVAPDADLYAVKVLTKDGSGSLFGIIGGIMWCIENKMDVVNMSLGTNQDNFLLKYAIQMLTDAGITVVAAAGNNAAAVAYPAAYDGVIAVSALDNSEGNVDGIAKFSSRGPQIKFIAPGVKVPSTVPFKHDSTGIRAYSGTSMASPHVAGLAALAVAQGAKNSKEVLAKLQKAAVWIQTPALTKEQQGFGIINAEKLVSGSQNYISRR